MNITMRKKAIIKLCMAKAPLGEVSCVLETAVS